MSRHRSLRRLVLGGATLFAVTAIGSLVALLMLVVSMRSSLERQTTALLSEQRIADRIVTSVYGQLFAAYQYLQEPRPAELEEFRWQGQRVYGELRKYLFHELPVEARLGVEQIKELHEALEVAAQRAFDHAARGDALESKAVVAELQQHAARLETAVDAFIRIREQQRNALLEQQSERLRGLVTASLVAAVLLLLGALGFATLLRRRVLQPLHALSAVTERLGEGELDARIPDQADEEFRAVAMSFNAMADRVQEAREEIESQNEELKQMLDQLQATQQELVQHEKLSALGGMLAGLAHELNNPLAGVLGMSEALAQELASADDPAMRALEVELVQPLLRDALRARGLVRNLLQFSRRSAFTLEAVSVADAVAVASGLCAYAFRQAGKSLVVEVAPDLTVLAERQQLEHAILNLAGNALDAMIQDGGDRLVVRAEPEGDEWISLAFEDEGPGFREPERAFDPFYTTKPVGAGTGLGLTLVHRFVDAFGGTVHAANRPHRGAVVTLRLRRASHIGAVAPASAPVEPASTPAAHPAGATAAMVPALERGSPRVLVVDDEPSVREIQRRMLHRLGAQVLLASSGAEARDILTREEVDVVISDVRMPGEMDGVDLFRWVRREREALSSRFLFVTGDLHDTPEEVTSLPAERLLEKPFDRTEYLARLRPMLAAHLIETAA